MFPCSTNDYQRIFPIYVTFIENGYPTILNVYVTTSEMQPVSFTITAPRTGYSENGVVQYGDVATFAFSPDDYELRSPTDRNKAIVVRSENDLQVYGANFGSSATSDSFLVLPKMAADGPDELRYISASYMTAFFVNDRRFSHGCGVSIQQHVVIDNT